MKIIAYLYIIRENGIDDRAELMNTFGPCLRVLKAARYRLKKEASFGSGDFKQNSAGRGAERWSKGEH